MNVAGIDIGSTTCKVVILGKTGDEVKILGRSLMDTGFNHRETAQEAFSGALLDAGLAREDIAFIVSTGYGRKNVDFSHRQVSEISCHGYGARHSFPNARLVIDIGGQDTKTIKIDENGRVADFCMNEKCAAGTGRFIEVIANVLRVPLENMGTMGLDRTKEISISSTCTVFAESEIISKIAQGVQKTDIINALHTAIVNRVYPMAKNLGIENDVVFTGGVARNIGVIDALGRKLNRDIRVPEYPQMMGALGAAIIAGESTEE